MSLIPFGFWGNGNYVIDGLKLYYDFATTACYIGSGTTVYNLAKNDFNGTVDGATFDGSDSGGCFSFDGVNDAIKPSPLSFYNNEIWGKNQSYEVWFKTTSTSFARLTGFIDTQNGSALFANQTLMLNYSISGANLTGYITAFVADNNDGIYKQRAIFTNYNTGVIDNNWHQLVSVYENTDVYVSNSNFNTQARLYIDGIEVSGYSIYPENTQNNGGIVFGDVDYNVWIGGSNYQQSLINPFNGKIGVVRIYNKALTESEISLNFNQYKIRYGL